MKKYGHISLFFVITLALQGQNSTRELLVAATNNDSKALNAALDARPRPYINFKNAAQRYQTALMNACEKCNPETVTILIKHNAKLNIQDEDKRTALMYVALAPDHQKSAAVAKILIDARAPLNTTDSEKKTALIHAFEQNNLPVAFELLQAGASTIKKDIFKKTAADYFNKQQEEAQKLHPELYEQVKALLEK